MNATVCRRIASGPCWSPYRITPSRSRPYSGRAPNFDIPIVPWGAGTGLSGGALPREDGVVLSTARMRAVLDIDLENRAVTVQPGVTNRAVTEAVEQSGFYYAPDPSSQIACSIGGNIAENSGGVHCLKYGTTTNNLLGLEVVLADGEVVRVGGKGMDQAGYDLLGLLTGSEGLLAITTEATLRILPKPEAAQAVMAVYDSVAAAGQAVAEIIASGMVPAGMEIMDQLSVEAVEEFVGAGYPLGVAALLLVELDGPQSEVECQSHVLESLLRQTGATEFSHALQPRKSGKSCGLAAKRHSQRWAGLAPTTTAWTGPFRGARCRRC